LRGFWTARFELSGLPASTYRGAAIGTTMAESGWRAVVRGVRPQSRLSARENPRLRRNPPSATGLFRTVSDGFRNIS